MTDFSTMDITSDSEYLPDELQYGYVADRVLRAIGDTRNDPDRRPDGLPNQGTLTFKAERSVKYTQDDPATITRDDVVCSIWQGDEYPDYQPWDGDGPDDRPHPVGLLTDEAGYVGNVKLIAGWYTVLYKLAHGDVPRQRIYVTPEHTDKEPLWLPRAAPITPAPSERFVVNEQVYRDTLAARDVTKSYRNQARQYRDQTEQAVTTGLTWAGSVEVPTDAPRMLHATLTGDVTLSLPTPGPERAFTVSLLLTQDGTGEHTVTIPDAQIAWSVPYVHTGAAGSTDLVHLLWTGTFWIAAPAAQKIGAPA